MASNGVSVVTTTWNERENIEKLVSTIRRAQVFEEVKAIDGVQEAFVSYGVFDLIVKIETDSMEQLKELITHRLRMISNVRSTLTLILAAE